MGKPLICLAAREITPETFLEFPSIDAYVNTACPRISLDAPGKFSKPVLTINEFMVACWRIFMGEHAQKRIIRKLDLERFLSKIAPQPSPQAHLEQYTISAPRCLNYALHCCLRKQRYYRQNSAGFRLWNRQACFRRLLPWS